MKPESSDVTMEQQVVTGTCSRCTEPATHDCPELFCDEHWARWWGGFDERDPPQDNWGPSQQMYEEALAEAREKRIPDGTRNNS